MKFIKITVKCTTETSDTVAYALHESGSMGEVFDDYDNVRQVLDDKRWDYADAKLFEETDGSFVSGFFPLETDVESVIAQINELKTIDYADFSMISCETEIIDSAEWENEWKKYYTPFNIGNVVIIPEWIDYTPSGGDVPLKLNPGLAFGTGMHETTSMCISLMQKIDLSAASVLDFGCGSGILGICAAKLGAKDVIFVDTDEQAVSATKYNCALNGIDSPKIYNCDVREIRNPADVVIANITADVLTDVESLIKSALKKGGYAIISGIISQKSEAVKATYERDFTLIDSEHKNEWSAYLFKL
ncbi:MAG: 50S ribosomal protein L11 methyltransferase [Clostridiales bacterium]|nr:50S ribosomal protein L11 methyltransferase [Clostridiales bacterium]